MQLIRAFKLFSFVIVLLINNSILAQDKPELIVQYSNRTTIAKMAFSDDGKYLASVDRSGFLVLRDVGARINFASLALKNNEINFIKFQGNEVFVCGDIGLEIIHVKNQSAVLSKTITMDYLYHYVEIAQTYYFIGSNGKLASIAKEQLSSNNASFNFLTDSKKQLCHLVYKGNQLLITGINYFVRYDLQTNKIIAEKTIPYNLSSYGAASSANGDFILPAYEKIPMAINSLSTHPQLGIASNYKLEKINTIGPNVGEMGIKSASIIDEGKKKIYLLPDFTASAISAKGILALGDYYGNIIIYDPVQKTVLDKIPSGTSVNQFIALSKKSNLLAIAAGNTKSSTIKILSLKDGKVMYESEEVNFDISKMAFTTSDSALVVFYPNQSIHEIQIKGNQFVKKVIKDGVFNAANRSYQLLNFTIGSGSLTSHTRETDFLRNTERAGSYLQREKQGLKITLVRGESLPKNQMPSYQKVNELLAQFNLANDLALTDQMDKDLLVMKAINYDSTYFYTFLNKSKIDATKAKKLYDYLQQPSGNQLLIEGIKNPIALKERPRGILLHPTKKQVFVIGEEVICKYDFDNEKIIEKNFKFRDKNDLSNYNFDLANEKFYRLEGNKISIYDLIQAKPKLNIYSFKGSVLYQSPDDYYYSTSKIPQMAFKYNGKILQFEQFDVRFNRPDKVLQTMGSSDTSLIQAYKKAYEKRVKKLGIDTNLFKTSYSIPTADFKNRDLINQDQKQEVLALNIAANDNEYPLDKFNIWVNENPVFGAKGLDLKSRNIKLLDTTINITLSNGENKIETTVTNINGIESFRTPLFVNYDAPKLDTGKVYFIGIGIDNFQEKSYNLSWSVKDIKDLAAKMKDKYGKNCSIDTLYNESVTMENIKSLKEKFLKTTVNDKIIIAYSGHGLLSKNYDYYLSTYKVNFNNPSENGLLYDDMEYLTDSIPARKKLMLIDACHSGEVDKDEMQHYEQVKDAVSSNLIKKGIVLTNKNKGNVGMKNSFELMQMLFSNISRSTGTTVISAAAGTQYALEKNELKNGVFTYSILEYMKANNDTLLSKLKTYVNKRVFELTAGLQSPTARNETNSFDWYVW